MRSNIVKQKAILQKTNLCGKKGLALRGCKDTDMIMIQLSPIISL